MLKKINYRKLLIRLSLIGLFFLTIGVVSMNRVVKKYGYDNAGDFLTNYWKNTRLKNDASPIHLNILISDADLNFIENKREEALERGIQINVGNNYVPCQLNIDGNEFVEGEIRLKGHMTDHLEGDKWSYRVKSKKPVMGMYRFSLQHPGTRNYAYEWVYHQLLKYEDIIYLYYDFIELAINDESKGIYAVEEHFGQHILERNNRPKGAILRWNPGLYWEKRIDMMDGIWLDEQYADYSSSYAEPYDKGVIKTNEELVKTYQKGAYLLEAFRRDSLPASEVFDLEKLARFHAIIDLVGGQHSLDWSDIKFYYNSDTKLLEPVGYESFSVRRSERIAGQRIPDVSSGMIMDYHDKIFADLAFYKLYIENLERIADEKYLNTFIKTIQTDLNEKLAILAIEWPYRKFSFDPYFDNIELIRHNLELPKALHAFIDKCENDSLYLSLAPVSDFPIEVFKVEINGDEKVKLDNVCLPAKRRNSFAEYYPLVIPATTKKVKKVELFCRIPGSDNKFKIKVNEYPSYDTKIHEIGQYEGEPIENHNQLSYDKPSSTFYFTSNEIVIDKPYTIPEHASLQISQGQQISFKKDGVLIISGVLEIEGDKFNPIQINSTGDEAVFRIYRNGKLKLNHIVSTDFENLISLSGGNCNIFNAEFSNAEGEIIDAVNGNVNFNNVHCGTVHRLGKFYQSKVSIDRLTANFGDTLINSNGSDIEIRSSHINGFDQFVDLDHISAVRSWGTSYDELSVFANVNNSSRIEVLGGYIRRTKIGFKMDQNAIYKGNSSYFMYKLKSTDIDKLEIN